MYRNFSEYFYSIKNWKCSILLLNSCSFTIFIELIRTALVGKMKNIHSRPFPIRIVFRLECVFNLWLSCCYSFFFSFVFDSVASKTTKKRGVSSLAITINGFNTIYVCNRAFSLKWILPRSIVSYHFSHFRFIFSFFRSFSEILLCSPSISSKSIQHWVGQHVSRDSAYVSWLEFYFRWWDRWYWYYIWAWHVSQFFIHWAISYRCPGKNELKANSFFFFFQTKFESNLAIHESNNNFRWKIVIGIHLQYKQKQLATSIGSCWLVLIMIANLFIIFDLFLFSLHEHERFVRLPYVCVCVSSCVCSTNWLSTVPAFWWDHLSSWKICLPKSD